MDDDADGDGLKKNEKILFFIEYSDTNDGDATKGWLIGKSVPLSTVLSTFKIVGGILLIWLFALVIRKNRFIRYDKRLSSARSIKELDRWYNNQIALAIEYGMVDFIGSRHLKADYEKAKKRLLKGEYKKEKTSVLSHFRKAIIFTHKDFKELHKLDEKDEEISGTEKIDLVSLIPPTSVQSQPDQTSQDVTTPVPGQAILAQQVTTKSIGIKTLPEISPSDVPIQPPEIQSLLPSPEIPSKLPEGPKE